MKILSLFTNPHVILNLYDLLSSEEHKNDLKNVSKVVFCSVLFWIALTLIVTAETFFKIYYFMSFWITQACNMRVSKWWQNLYFGWTMRYFSPRSCHLTFAVVVDECNAARLVRAPFWVTVENPTVVKASKFSGHHFFSLWPLHIEMWRICTKDNAVVLCDAQLNPVCITLSRNAGEAEMMSRCGPVRGHCEIHDCIWERTHFTQINAMQFTKTIGKQLLERTKKKYYSVSKLIFSSLKGEIVNIFNTVSCLFTLITK